MQTINFSKKMADSLENLPLGSEIFNTEGKMYKFNYYGNRELVLKSLYNTSGFIFANKLYTLEMLDANSHLLPRNFCIPNYLISVNKTVVGFALPFVKGENFLTLKRNPYVSDEEKLYYYKKVGDVLDQLDNIRKYTSLKNVYLNDLHEANIMVNPDNREINIIDLDSCKIGTNCAFGSKYLIGGELLDNKPFKYNYNDDNSGNGPGYLVANENSDIYCYIMMLLNFLLDDNMWRISKTDLLELLDYLGRVGFNKELLDCINLLTVPNKDNENPREYLNTVTSKQIVKARKFYTGRI